jgi:hypothetical protein
MRPMRQVAEAAKTKLAGLIGISIMVNMMAAGAGKAQGTRTLIMKQHPLLTFRVEFFQPKTNGRCCS